ncbi:diguanylate cyclase (GGDEF) domain-containing protein [Desulfocicer vacuolatum DSM 3385]|uniref:diguanylate cyclase n=1 Tax=Desulfocicer vacuolatum DSM 3385 TaxID=1121400 RepID=A0A1W2DJM4_9BACT|nr:diguanylate cyclase [Desulfocicer vacuolatum]SMC97731.1 diguanylate cyclase (GGDEF) domain-containing protein [Desulfocicer vacuolatum DSM 3385]
MKINFTKLLNSIVCIVILFSLPGISCSAPSSSHVNIDTRFEKINLGQYMDVLVDPNGHFSIFDITRGEAREMFVPHGGDGLFMMPPTRKIVWVRFTLDMNSTSRILPYLNLELGRPRYRVDFFQSSPEPSAPFLHKRLSHEQPSARGDFNFRHLMFKVDLRGQKQITCYLRFQVYGTEVIPMVLRTPEAFRIYTAHDHLLFGMAYGIMLSMIFYNLFLFLALGRREYLQYVLYICAFLSYLFIFMGHFSNFFSLDIQTALTLEYTCLGSCIILGFLFCRNFFNMSLMAPVWEMLLALIAVLGGGIFVTGITGLFVWADILCNIAGLFSSTILISIGFIQWRKGFKPARIYICANVVFTIGTGIFILWVIGVLPTTVPGEQILVLGPVFESILLSFSLAYKIRLMERDRLRLSKSRDKFRMASRMDGMTGLYNKKFFLDQLRKEVESAFERERSLCLLIMDVDNFKLYNDTYGHPEGDVVLKTLARVISDGIRQFDYACRYGGEEFCVIFPDTQPRDAFYVAERIRKKFSAVAFHPRQDEIVGVTISMGVGVGDENDTEETLLKKADIALYRAKQLGKNKTCTMPQLSFLSESMETISDEKGSGVVCKEIKKASISQI